MIGHRVHCRHCRWRGVANVRGGRCPACDSRIGRHARNWAVTAFAIRAMFVRPAPGENRWLLAARA